MKFVRRASLVFSLVLIVAIVVGYVVRSSELDGDRNLRLTASVELGAAHLTSVIDATTVAARAASDPDTTARALASVDTNLGVCVLDGTDRACAGDGPMPDEAVIETALADRTSGAFESGGTPVVTVHDSVMTIEASGSDVTVLASAPASFVGSGAADPVEVTTLLPAGVGVGGFADDREVRQTSTDVPSAAGVYVVATSLEPAALPAEEYRFYAIIFTLAVVLMVLAGITLFVEQRNLLERASFDALTKLPNRSEFERRALEALGNADRTETGACLLLFDLNGFKQVNDTYGHAAGDEMLKVVATRLRKAVRDDDIVARWGGDEFVVVMPGITTEEMGSRRALQLAEEVAGRTRLEGILDPLRVKVSVGVSVWEQHGTELSELVVAADRAMYEAKREGVTCRVAAPVVERRVSHSAT